MDRGAVLTETGWSAEIAIPFKILRFSIAENQVWGLNFERVIKQKNEFAYWAGWNRNYEFTDISQSGHLAGISDIRQAERIRLRPYIVSGVESFKALAKPRHTFVREIGIDDLKVSLTSNLTADATLNPDFAQTEADAQQINLTRFSLFFPEKRQFFIEEADSFRMTVGGPHFGPSPLEVFYSRKIGLSDAGEPIPLIGGGKMTVQQHRSPTGVVQYTPDRPAFERFLEHKSADLRIRPIQQRRRSCCAPSAVQLHFSYDRQVFILYNETRFTDGMFSAKSNRSLVLKVTYSVHR
jgi:hypothetical protein